MTVSSNKAEKKCKEERRKVLKARNSGWITSRKTKKVPANWGTKKQVSISSQSSKEEDKRHQSAMRKPEMRWVSGHFSS